MNLFDLLKLLSGKKTYLTIAVVFALLFGTWQGWWTIPNEIYAALFALALAFIRAGVSKATPDGPVPIRPILSALLLTAVIAGTAGCAICTQRATTTTTATNGVVTVTVAQSRLLAIGDAKNTVDRVKASAGKTSSVGASNVDQEGSATNAASLAGEFLGELVKHAK